MSTKVKFISSLITFPGFPRLFYPNFLASALQDVPELQILCEALIYQTANREVTKHQILLICQPILYFFLSNNCFVLNKPLGKHIGANISRDVRLGESVSRRGDSDSAKTLYFRAQICVGTPVGSHAMCAPPDTRRSFAVAQRKESSLTDADWSENSRVFPRIF